MIRLGVLGSTNGTDLGSIIQAIDAEELKAKISSLISPLRAFEFSSDRPTSFGPLPSIGERYPPNTK